MKKNIQSVCKFVLEIRTSIVDRYLDSIEICPNQEWIEENKHKKKKVFELSVSFGRKKGSQKKGRYWEMSIFKIEKKREKIDR